MKLNRTFEAIGTALFYYTKQHLLAESYRLVVRDVGGITFFDKGLFLMEKDNFMFHNYDYTVKYAEILLCTIMSKILGSTE